jgi:hypothetical protein
MNSIHVMAVTFGCICAAVAVGTFIRRRLKEHHLTSPTQEVVKVSAGVVATLTALVLGLLIGGSKQSYDSKVGELRTFVVNISLLDRAMSHYEASLMAERRHLAEFTKVMLGGLWGTDPNVAQTGLLAPLDRIRNELRRLNPQTDPQKFAQARMMALTDTLMLAGAQMIETDDAEIPLPLFVIVDGWLAVIFLGFAIFAPVNRVTVPAFAAGAAAISIAVFLIVEMNDPFRGVIMIPKRMMEQTLEQITQAQKPSAAAPTPPRSF